MGCTVIVGTDFGDEGKGKVVDYYAQVVDVVVRYAGGPNAGHTIYYNGAKIVLRLVPSGIFNEGVRCILAQGMVIDPIVLSKEILNLRHKGIDLADRLHVSNRAHVITAKHIEDDKGSPLCNKVGTTKKGIGPAYTDKASRSGLRIHDLITATDKDMTWLRSIAGGKEEAVELKEAIDIIRPFVTDTAYLVNTCIASGHEVLFEGAQGTMLDIDHGTYPFVTSSNSIAGGACTGSGVGPNKIGQVVGITKAYSTRVGDGPFPTEVNGDISETIRQAGGEFGSVTKRPRRIGWFDVPLTKYAAMINGLDVLIVTKLDILSSLDKIKVCVSYGGLDIVPVDLAKRDIPEYAELDGWANTDIGDIDNYDDLPENARVYIEFIEAKVGVPIGLISVGPNREQVIDRSEHVREVYAQGMADSLQEVIENEIQPRIDAAVKKEMEAQKKPKTIKLKGVH